MMMRTTIIPAAIAPILVDPSDEGWVPPPLVNDDTIAIEERI